MRIQLLHKGFKTIKLMSIACNYNKKISFLFILSISLLTFNSCRRLELPNNVQQVISAPADLAYSPSQSVALVGQSGNSATPGVNNGGASVVYSISSGAVTGISIDASTGVISWTNGVSAGSYNLTVVATNSIGAASCTYTLVVQSSGGGTGSLSNFSYTPDSASIYHGIAGMSQTPMITGTPSNYSISGAPAGVSINASTGEIMWSNVVDYGSYSFSVTASNSTGSASTVFKLIVKLNPDDYLTPRYTVSVTSNVAYGPTSGSFHLVDVYSPVGDNHTKRPAFMFMHGGGFQSSGTKTESYVVEFCTYLAKCGYVAFAPNYNEGNGHTLPQNLAAAKDADLCLQWIRNNGATYQYDPTYLFVGGGSAGAHLACNFAFFDGSSNYGGYQMNLSNVIAFADCWGSSPDRDRLYNYSSLNSNSIPVFIVQGTNDQTVPIAESITLNSYLTAAHSIVDFWQIPGETHGCPNHRPAISDTMSHFFNRVWKMKR